MLRSFVALPTTSARSSVPLGLRALVDPCACLLLVVLPFVCSTHASAVPSQPMNVSFRGVTNASVLVRWHQPKFPNGIIQGYRLYYMHKNYTDVQTIRDPEEEMEHNLEGLGTSRVPRFPPFLFGTGSLVTAV